MGKTDVNGDHANPLFEWLKTEQPGIMGLKRVKWNFEKFLVGRDGRVKGRWASVTKPESLEPQIIAELEKKARGSECLSLIPICCIEAALTPSALRTSHPPQAAPDGPQASPSLQPSEVVPFYTF
ncbi:hypothetical protein DL769_009482 [Monosporascus sp. CRB-8-3]|nr:hypothetical protein DL769_009482 [Monosporascus sp. CRB-8-3]